jgi:histone H3/H4
MADLTKQQPTQVESLHTIIEVADRNLQGVDQTPFSEPAFLRFKESVSSYISQLFVESIKTARRHQSETVSTSDVERANQYLISSSSHKVYRHFGTIGGILLGASVSNLLSMVTTNAYNINGIIVTVILAIIGSFLVALHMSRE